MAGTVSRSAVAGVATFSGLQIDRTGFDYRLIVTSGSLTGALTGNFDVVAFTARGGTLQLGFEADDPVLPDEPGLPPDYDGTPGSGVAEVRYYLCGGYQNTTACTSSNGTLIGQSSTGPDYHVDWSVPASLTPGPFRVVSVLVDNVGNRKDATSSTPLRIS